MGRLLIILWTILLAESLSAAIWTSGPDEPSVQSNIVNHAVSGDTVFMTNATPGTILTNHWTWTLTNNPAQPNIIISAVNPMVGCSNDWSVTPDTFNPATSTQGPYRPTNYVNSTAIVIVDDTANTSPLISLNFVSNSIVNGMNGFTIIPGTNSIPDRTKPSVLITGTSLLTRVNNMHWFNVGRTDLEWDGWVGGSFDHNVLWQSANYTGVELNNDKYGGMINGNGAWADTNNYFGTTNFPYIESNSGTNPRSAQGLVDGSSGNGGAMFVARYNCCTNWNFGWHGTESSQYHRGTRRFELYGNTMFFDTNSGSSYFTGAIIRSGVGVIFNNYWYGYDAIATVYAYRSTPGSFTPWGPCDGTNAWDLTASNILSTGTATLATNTPTGSTGMLTDTNASWTPSQWLGGYMLKNTTSGQHAEIIGNTATTALYNVSSPISGTLAFAIGDHYQIAGLVTAQLDQPGRNGGDTITNDNSSNPFNSTRGGIVAWPNESLLPIYEWSNRYIRSLSGNFNRPYITSSSQTLQTNRDYIDGVQMPGYTPLVFPNPLVSVSDPFITQQPLGQTVTVGQTATFTVTGSTVVTPLSYQWAKGGVNIAGATLSSYTTPATVIGDNGSTFAVQVCNATNSCITSSSATLTVTNQTTTITSPSTISVSGKILLNGTLQLSK